MSSRRCSTETLPEEATEAEAKTEQSLEPLYQIILFDDDDHSYPYVTEMLCNIFGMDLEQAYSITYEVDYCGQAVVKTCPYEEAVAGKDAIIHYGPDPSIEKCKGSMYAIVQEAP